MKIEGVIIPPPEVRAIVDKTAQFVARNGKGFEQKVLNSNDGKTAKFNFLKAYDPYNAYYEMKIRELEDSGEAESRAETSIIVDNRNENPSNDDTNETEKTTSITSSSYKSLTGVMKMAISNPISRFSISSKMESINKMDESSGFDPQLPDEYEFCASHPTELSHLEIDIIKMTAQYTAVNGREFLGDLAQRERKNPQFDFLKPTHMLFTYFTSLVDSYARSLQPSGKLLSCVQLKMQNTQCLVKALYRWEWNNEDKEKKQIEKSLDEIGNVLLTSIDWNEFSVVETITFAVDELLLLGVRSQDEINSSFERNEVKNNYRSSSVGIQNGQGDGSIPAQPSSNVICDDDDDDDDDGLNVLNNANYIPRVASTSVTNLPNAMVDPISGRIIPVEQISDHMRIQLMDPKWIEQQKRFINKQHDTGFAEGISIADSLKSFARQRGDIFGSGSLNEVDGCEDNVTNSYDSRIDDENDASSIELKGKRKFNEFSKS